MPERQSALWRQVFTLANKNFKILYGRHFVSTTYTAILLPIILTVYIGIGRNLNSPGNEFGIADPSPIRSFEDGLRAADSSRDKVVFVNSGFTGGDISEVIDSLSRDVEAAGKEAPVVETSNELGLRCRSTFRRTTTCYGAVIFHSSPNEGEGGIWNYTLRGDGAFGTNFEVNKDNNDAQIYTLPFQRAIDAAIARVSGDNAPSLDNSQAYAFSDQTEDEREAQARRDYAQTFLDYLGVSFILALIGTAYRMPGQMATERELGLSQLIDAMMPVKHDWEPQLARMLSYLYAYVTAYGPGWIIAGAITKSMIWDETSVGVVVPFFILAGLALTSQALLGGAPFKKAQLSGIVNTIIYVLLGVLAQALPNPPTPVVAVLSVLFTPCNFIFFIHYIARYEAEGQAANLTEGAPGSNSSLPGYVHWIFFGIQFVVYPILAAFIERYAHGISSESRKMYKGDNNGTPPQDAVQVHGLTKVYRPGLFRRMFSFISKPRPATIAVNKLDLTAKRGQILALLGANGSGKSTTLDAIAGLHPFTQGTVTIDASDGIGIAPQKNVLWDELTVYDHIKIFNELKSPFAKASPQDINDLISAIGLSQKKKAQVQNLSGGQKRKLQLGLMLTGGSAVCLVDEVSSGIDPLSRRKIWDILLAERGRRTIIMTTHFLDEADLLADNIAILSKGQLRAEGSSVALKHRLGAGYRVHVLNAKNVRDAPPVPGVDMKVTSTNIIYTAPSSGLAAEVIRVLESAGLEYRLSSPTIEDVFLHVAEEVKDESRLGPSAARHLSTGSEDQGYEMADKPLVKGKESPELLSGKPIGFFKQTFVLIQKRILLLRSNWIPYVVPFLIPIIAAAATQLMINDERPLECVSQPLPSNVAIDYGNLVNDAILAAGPASQFDGANLEDLFGDIIPTGDGGSANTQNMTLEEVNSFSNLRRYVEDNRMDILPGAWWLGSDDTPPTVAYRADEQAIARSVAAQNLLNNMRTNVSIATKYLPHDSPVGGLAAQALQMAIFFCIAVNIAPAFFGMYPNLERRMAVRGLQYSSGVRSLPQWISHLSFDFTIFALAMIVAGIVFAVTSEVWYAVGYLFPVLVLFAVCNILLSYVVSLFTDNQLATFASNMAFNTVGFAIYMIAFLYIMTFSPATAVDQNLLIGHYTIALFFPAGSLFRAFLVGLNIFFTACDGDAVYSYPGHINAYGAPILYLTVQSLILFAILLYHDSGNKLPSFLQGKQKPTKGYDYDDAETAAELLRVEAAGDDGLQVKHLTKTFDKYTAVDNVTFGVQHGEVFALLGPNGAGKSTTISLIRGDIKPSKNGGDVFIEKISVSAQRAAARANLGVCPQFDAIDNMTVVEHLRHYARIRGISNVEYQVQAVIRAVGLEAFKNTLAPHLSGGNKRKLSLGIALTGNPSVILLDEPSSGLDAAAKRIMWRTLESIVPGRSILLTTHSMEEADALASRAGILARHMLAVGEVDTLRQRFGDSLYVHLVCRSAPHSTQAEMDRIRSWVLQMFPSASVEADTYHGQMRFSVPASQVMQRSRMMNPQAGQNGGSAIGQLIVMLEENKELLGIEHHSVAPTTLNDVFLSIVGQHNVVEEGYRQVEDEKVSGWMKARKFLIGF
jgi:ABC-type multidrug transport system ATPase subunit